MTETGRRIKSLLETECIPAINQRSECMGDWYKMAQTIYLQTQILKKDVDNYERALESLSYRLCQESEERHENFVHLLDRFPGRQQIAEKSSVSTNETIKTLPNICDLSEELRELRLIVYDSAPLIDEIERCSKSMLENSHHEL